MDGTQEHLGVHFKNADDIHAMRLAGQAAAQVLIMIEPHVRAGVSTAELDRICREFIIGTLGCQSATIGYTAGGTKRPFTGAICTSVNHVVCHGVPGDKILKAGDILNIDVTVIKNGFHGDTSRMYFVGEPSVMARRLVECSYQAMLKGIACVRPGAHLGDIGHAIQSYVESQRFSVVREYCGHGIGQGFHEAPQVLHYGQQNSGMTLLPGMCFTIEPMVNAGKPATRELPDGWTVVTKDHSLSAQWEHTLLVTPEGVEVLTLRNGQI
ncbi:MAG: type I methionyl aminopeptidase [Gammaproteobacteria bacterium]|nr:type I methionyl aminopeptidase [Gammaproteobacteria bacterium]